MMLMTIDMDEIKTIDRASASESPGSIPVRRGDGHWDRVVIIAPLAAWFNEIVGNGQAQFRTTSLLCEKDVQRRFVSVIADLKEFMQL